VIRPNQVGTLTETIALAHADGGPQRRELSSSERCPLFVPQGLNASGSAVDG